MDEYLSRSIEKIREDAAQRYVQLGENLNILAKLKPRDFLVVNNLERTYPGTVILEPFGCAGYVTKVLSINNVTDIRGMQEKGIIVEFKKCELLFPDDSFRRFDKNSLRNPSYTVYDDSKLHTEETAEAALKKLNFSLDDILKDLE